jgi:hypothetical protein
MGKEKGINSVVPFSFSLFPYPCTPYIFNTLQNAKKNNDPYKVGAPPMLLN